MQITEGKISKWNIKIDGEEFFHSILKGQLSDEFDVENIFKIDSSWSGPVFKDKGRDGIIEGRYVLREKRTF